MRTAVLACLIGLWTSSPAYAADSITGLWLTQPDRKDLISHIKVEPCGSGFCGTVLRAFDSTGAQVTTANVGRQLFWDMKPMGDGSYGGGEAFVPLINATTKKVTLVLDGDQLRVEGRIGPVRGAQVWTRLE
jgi:uncharacterized protein (DUF2147 family)